MMKRSLIAFVECLRSLDWRENWEIARASARVCCSRLIGWQKITSRCTPQLHLGKLVEEPDEYEYTKRVQTRSSGDLDKGSSKINLSHCPSEFVSRLAERSPFPGLGAASEVRLEAQACWSSTFASKGGRLSLLQHLSHVPRDCRRADPRRSVL